MDEEPRAPGPRAGRPAIKEQALVLRLERIRASEYVNGVRRDGRENLDPDLRAEMAGLYEDLRPLLHRDRLSPRSRAVLRLAEPVLQAEWKLLSAPDPDPPAGQPWTLPLERRGKHYVPYANLRVLNQVLGTNRHATDAAVERSVWAVVSYLAASWAAFEERTLAGTETWNQLGTPSERVLVERSNRLRAVARTAAGSQPVSRIVAEAPPDEWRDYLEDPPGWRRLEFLSDLPQTRFHEEVAFIRTLHLTEACMWGILARVVSAVEWIKRRDWPAARAGLVRANRLAEVQNEVLEIMKTMTVEAFLAFRENTGESSAVQSTTNHLLHIYMQGVDPAKEDALAKVPENEYLLRYANPHFLPLRRALDLVPTDEPDGRAVIDEVRRLDQEMYRWRASHYGVARRYVPELAAGTGGTDGAAYLKRFYTHRIFAPAGQPPAPPHVTEALDRPEPFERGRARPIFSWQN